CLMSLWDALRMNMMISYQELVRTFPRMLFLMPKYLSSEKEAVKASLKVQLSSVMEWYIRNSFR
ncbi:hypothetical protein, partial [Klebsiella pneumoniae]|uniref:hypothetical protein n=1 Tax=Klebsiella pneumoniae TaxID=573 RepID=UPI001C4FD862